MIARGDILVERDDEIDGAGSALDLVAEGGGRVVSIEGPAGIGKTALLAAVREQAEGRGFRIFSARGSELEIDFPFGVVRQLFEARLQEKKARARALADAAAPAAAAFEALPGSEAPTPTGPVSFSVLHGLFWMTLNLAGEEPALLFVDDLHWCDRPSLRYLSYLSKRLEGESIGLVTGLRSTDPGVDPALVADIVGDPATIAIRPEPLSVDAVGEIVDARFEQTGDAEFGAACRQVTGGNPLLLHQLLSGLSLEGTTPTARDAAAITEIGPRAVSRTVLHRLRRLPPEATELARAVAILGDGTDISEIAAQTGRELSDVARVTGSLAQSEILRSGAPLGFAHPLVRDVVYQDIPIAERQLQHARAAKMMDEAGAAPEKVAAQLLASPPSGDDWVADRLEAAAAKAMVSGAVDSAVTYQTRLFAEPLDPSRRANVLLQLGVAEAGSGGPDAIEHLEAAYRSLDAPELRGVAAYALARFLLFVGSPQRSAEVASEARQELRELKDLASIVESVELISVYFGADVPDAEERYRKHRELSEDPSGGESVLAAAAAYDWAYRGGSAAECAGLAVAAMDRAIQMEVDTGLTWIVANGVLVAAEHPDAMEQWDRALARSHQQGSMFGAMTVHLWRGFTQLHHGDLLGAEESLLAGIEQISLLGGATLDYAYGLLASTLIAQGRVEDAEAALFAIDRPEGVNDGAMLWRAAEIQLLLARGDAAEDALGLARAHSELCDWRTNPAFAQSLTFQAQALEALGRTDEAIEVLRRELELCEAWGAPGATGRTLRLLGELRRDDGAEDLRRAIELLERSPMKLELARAHAALGGVMRRGRKPTDAREPLRKAFELAEVCGARGLAAEVRTELHATGARPRSSALKGPGSLTASEKRVSALAAEGQTNKQIAQSLYVTPKTVEVHLSNAYRKLEIGSRRELAGALNPP